MTKQRIVFFNKNYIIEIVLLCQLLYFYLLEVSMCLLSFYCHIEENSQKQLNVLFVLGHNF